MLDTSTWSSAKSLALCFVLDRNGVCRRYWLIIIVWKGKWRMGFRNGYSDVECL